MKKLSVLFEAGPMADAKKTGVGHYVEQLVTSLQANHTDDIALTGYYFDFLNRNNKHPATAKNVSFIKIRYLPGKLISLCRRLGFQPFLEIFVRKPADIVFFTNFVALPMLKKRKVALAVYDVSFLDEPSFMQSINLAFLQHFCPSSIIRADLIITISEFTKERILHHFPHIRADIIVTPIPPPAITPKRTGLTKNLRDLGIKNNRYILYVGTIEPRKNLQNLIKAYVLLPEAVRKKNSLVLAGGKGWKDEDILAEIARQQANGMQIIQTGYVSDEEKAALYNNASCSALASHYEGFGMPILEAMQYDIPTAVSDIQVFHEVADNASLYFNKDDPTDIASKLTTLLTDGLVRKKLIIAGRERLSHFSWERNAKQVYASFKRHAK